MNWVAWVAFSLLAFGIAQMLLALRALELAIRDLESELLAASESDEE